MAVKVQIKSNPYKRKLNILINGEAVSEYSRLEKYMNMPFESICDDILEDIYYELNRMDYILEFQARKIELDIMEKIAEAYPHCLAYIRIPLEYDLPLNKRMAALCEVINSYRIDQVPFFERKVLLVHEGIDINLIDEIRSIVIENQFCRLPIYTKSLSEYTENLADSYDLILLAVDSKRQSKAISQFSNISGHLIIVNEKNGFLSKNNRLFLFETDENYVFQCIFECIMFRLLLDIFSNVVHYVKSRLHDEKGLSEIDRITSSEYRVWLTIEQGELEVGTHLHVELNTDAPGREINKDDYYFQYRIENIVSIEGMRMIGLQEGDTTVYLYKKGDITPCGQYDIHVVRRNRITSLHLDMDDTVLGIGDKERLFYEYYPPDADNVDTVEWKSENADIVSVNDYGEIMCTGLGTTNIWLIAERASTCCRITVLPLMEQIVTNFDSISMQEGQRKSIVYRAEPANCINPDIHAYIEDNRIAYLDKHVITAYEPGETKLILESESKTIRREIRIKVEKQEAITVEKESKGLIKGFIKNIFGG